MVEIGKAEIAKKILMLQKDIQNFVMLMFII